MAYRMQSVPYRGIFAQDGASRLWRADGYSVNSEFLGFSPLLLFTFTCYLLRPVTAQHRRKLYMVRYHHVGPWFGVSIPDVSTSSPLVSRAIYYPQRSVMVIFTKRV